jgi:hypothetical protein
VLAPDRETADGSEGDVPEGNMNAEIAGHLREHGHGGGHQGQEGQSRFRIELVEIIEAILLAIVVLSTAFSGYQAAKWDGVSAGGYATSSRLRVQSEQASLTSNQTLIYDSSNLTAWLQAQSSGNTKLASILAHRFTPNYAPAFRAWLATRPLTNPKAPVGPRYMPQYRATRSPLRPRHLVTRRHGPTPPQQTPGRTPTSTCGSRSFWRPRCFWLRSASVSGSRGYGSRSSQ